MTDLSSSKENSLSLSVISVTDVHCSKRSLVRLSFGSFLLIVSEPPGLPGADIGASSFLLRLTSTVSSSTFFISCARIFLALFLLSRLSIHHFL